MSLSLSVVNAVGYVAEAEASESLRRSLPEAGRKAIEEYHVLAALKSATIPLLDPQFIVGINTGPGVHCSIDGALEGEIRLHPVKYRPCYGIRPRPGRASRWVSHCMNQCMPIEDRRRSCG
jgi:hypothetical protein